MATSNKSLEVSELLQDKAYCEEAPEDTGDVETTSGWDGPGEVKPRDLMAKRSSFICTNSASWVKACVCSHI